MTPPYDIRERSFLFSCAVVRFCRSYSAASGCSRLFDQLLDAATSIAANAEEAKGSYSRREFAHKNCIALKEARESRMWLRVVAACSLAPTAQTEPLLQEAGELVGIFTGIVKRSRVPVALLSLIAVATVVTFGLPYFVLLSIF